jgi:hypothetical protein
MPGKSSKRSSSSAARYQERILSCASTCPSSNPWRRRASRSVLPIWNTALACRSSSETGNGDEPPDHALSKRCAITLSMMPYSIDSSALRK